MLEDRRGGLMTPPAAPRTVCNSRGYRALSVGFSFTALRTRRGLVRIQGLRQAGIITLAVIVRRVFDSSTRAPGAARRAQRGHRAKPSKAVPERDDIVPSVAIQSFPAEKEPNM